MDDKSETNESALSTIRDDDDDDDDDNSICQPLHSGRIWHKVNF